MKRMHVHVAVNDLDHSIGFYSALFAAQPAVVKMDYAKWMLDDPRVNFAISTRGRQPGLDHLGIQVEDKDELQEIYARLHEAGGDALTYLTRIILQCYYRDDRVMRSLDLEARPPFPKGFEVEQGDWSLLDQVRARPKLWREVS